MYEQNKYTVFVGCGIFLAGRRRRKEVPGRIVMISTHTHTGRSYSSMLFSVDHSHTKWSSSRMSRYFFSSIDAAVSCFLGAASDCVTVTD